MRREFWEIGAIIRGVALLAPAVAVGQSGCGTMTSSGGSCDGFQSQLIENRVPIRPGKDSGAGITPPTTPEACADFCMRNDGGYGTECRLESADGGKVVVCSFHTMCTGRRPDGYEPPARGDRGPLLGRYFAAMAADEAASVVAFERMALELAEHGMPAHLVELARRSALEEERHFRIAAGLSQRFGVRATRGRVAPRGARTLLDFAIENARAGVVEETLGAIMGHFQAEHAHEAVVRRAMRQIAREETSHAVLSWRVDASARERLSNSERDVLDGARDDALRDMAYALEAPVPEVLAERAGVPPPSLARALFGEARTRLFSSSAPFEVS